MLSGIHLACPGLPSSTPLAGWEAPPATIIPGVVIGLGFPDDGGWVFEMASTESPAPTAGTREAMAPPSASSLRCGAPSLKTGAHFLHARGGGSHNSEA